MSDIDTYIEYAERRIKRIEWELQELKNSIILMKKERDQ